LTQMSSVPKNTLQRIRSQSQAGQFVRAAVTS
jgi:hypothetical protein